MKKVSKNVTKLLPELLFTVLVAGIGSWLLAFGLLFILANFNLGDETRSYVNYVSGILFGFVVGYKLKELVPSAKKK